MFQSSFLCYLIILIDGKYIWVRRAKGSAKSYFITQKLIVRACREQIKILVCRRTATTIRNTCFSLFKDILTKWKLTPYVRIRESDFNIKFPNGSEIIFIGLDEETKLLSLNNIGCIFIEETFEVPKSIVEQLNLRLRGKTPNQQIIMAFNPISKNHWLYDFCEVEPPSSFIFSHSTYKDNPFLNAEYVAELEELYIRNPQKARIFCDGEWGVDNELLVYTNWTTEAFDVLDLVAKGYECRIGLDEGFTDASAIVSTLYDKASHTIYVFDEFYKSGVQLDDIANALADMRANKNIIWCDNSAPRLIDYLRRQGFSAKPCIKGADSVVAGIMFLQNHRIIVHPKCVNVIKELENYSYIKDKNGNITDKTTHEYSHSLDALRYAYSNIYKNKSLTTIEKGALGL